VTVLHLLVYLLALVLYNIKTVLIVLQAKAYCSLLPRLFVFIVVTLFLNTKRSRSCREVGAYFNFCNTFSPVFG